jgi:anti-sigma factor RsiW
VPVTAADATDRDLACREFIALITDYVEGTLDPATVEAVQRHLAECPDCEVYLAQMRRTIEALGAVGVQSLSEQATEGIVAAFRDLRRPG